MDFGNETQRSNAKSTAAPRTKRITASISLEVSLGLRERLAALVNLDNERHPTIAQVIREACVIALPTMERESRKAIAKRQPLEES